jgi:hypothetical protein
LEIWNGAEKKKTSFLNNAFGLGFMRIADSHVGNHARVRLIPWKTGLRWLAPLLHCLLLLSVYLSTPSFLS